MAVPVAIAVASRAFSILAITLWNATEGAGRPDPFMAWDGEWYLRVVQDGYHAAEVNGGQDYAFYPLWPILLKVVSLDGLVPVSTVGVVMANLFLVVALVAIWRLVERRFDPAIATGTVALIAFAPTAYVFSMVYTEALFLMLAGLYFAVPPASRWRPPLAALVVLTRIQGLALIVSAAYRAIVARGRERRIVIAAALFGLAAFGAWFLYIAVLTGNPLGWTTGSTAWLHDESGVTVLWRNLRAHPIRVTAFSAYLVVLGVGTLLLFRRNRELFVYAATVLAICSLPLVIGGLLHNVPRYATLAFPAFAGLAAFLGRRATIALVVVFAVAQVAYLGWVIPVVGSQSP